MNKAPKMALTSFVILMFIAYSYQQRHEEASGAVVMPKTAQTPQAATTQSTAPTSTTKQSNTVSAQYKDGTYTGSAADAFYGNIQVQAVISGGRITDVVFLQYPNDHHESVQINKQAMPYLKQEALQAQNSQVDGVSGATDTSVAFRESLASALQKARS